MDAATDSLETRKTHARTWFEELRDKICAAFEKLEADLPPENLRARPGSAPIIRASVLPKAGKRKMEAAAS
jgi:coproporphyrinogen III oxidase